MSPRQWRKKLKRQPLHPGQILVEDQAGFKYPLGRVLAAKLVKDGIARPVPCRGGVKLQECPNVRAIYSTRYLRDRFSSGLRLYRDDLITTVTQSKTGKPATAQRSHHEED